MARTERSARLGPYTPADERGLTFRIVSALRTDGYTTGFFGDGVNDLPAPHATVRRATVDDVAPLVRLRGLMLTDMGVDTGGPEAVWRAAAGRWFAERLRRPDEFAAFVIDDPALGVVAGATGVCDGRAPSPADPSGLHGHVFNVSTDPARRRRCHACACVATLLTWFREETPCTVVDLNATGDGGDLYASFGFAAPPHPALQLRMASTPARAAGSGPVQP